MRSRFFSSIFCNICTLFLRTTKFYAHASSKCVRTQFEKTPPPLYTFRTLLANPPPPLACVRLLWMPPIFENANFIRDATHYSIFAMLGINSIFVKLFLVPSPGFLFPCPTCLSYIGLVSIHKEQKA